MKPKTLNKTISKDYPFTGIFLFCLFLTSCEPEPEKYGDCVWDTTGGDCRGFSFSIVDAETNENLMGTHGEPIHPDSVMVRNSRGDEMSIIIKNWSHPDFENGWDVVEYLDPFQELYCFNMCTNDSSFTRTYYMYLGNGDTDTIEVFFPARTNPYKVFYNGSLDKVIAEIEQDTSLEFTTHYFLKNFN